jgi:hypothetical protein
MGDEAVHTSGFGRRRSRNKRADREAETDSAITVGGSVRVYAGSEREQSGVVIEDFEDDAGQPVDIGEHHIVDAARRWAVRLDDDTLVFVSSSDITPA